MRNSKINMKPTDMSLTSRIELANKFDEMLESVEKENTAFLITNAGKTLYCVLWIGLSLIMT